jgi:membrane protease YdiL (CAAX protease family)
MLLFLSLRGLFGGDREKALERGAYLEKVTAALQTTKYAYAANSLMPRDTSSQASSPAKIGREAVKSWQKLTASASGRVSAWRRLGITQYTFGQTKEGMATLRKIAGLPPTMREREPMSAREKKRNRPEERPPWADISPAQEAAFWEALYGPQPITKADVPRLKAMLERLELNWFAHLAREQLYTKAGMTEDARQERHAALATSQGVVFWTVWHLLLLLSGILALAVFGAVLWNGWQKSRRTRSQPPPIPEAAVPVRTQEVGSANGLESGGVPAYSVPLPPPVSSLTHDPFSYRARLLAFLAYFVVPLVALPFSMLLQTKADAWPSETIGRVNAVFYLVFAALSVATSLWVLRRLARAETPERPPLSLRETLSALGLRSRSLAADVGTGLVGHAMTLPLLLIATAVSQFLFSRFKTPPHPVLFQFVTMSSPLDQALLLLQTAVVAAITEEIMFRGVLYPALRARWGVTKAIVLSAAVFALAHPTLPGGFLPLWLLGVSFAIVYERRGSLWPGILMHALNNGTLILTQFSLFAK